MTRTWGLAATAIVGGYLALWPHALLAQAPAPPASFDFPRADVTGGIGWFNARADGDGCCRWVRHSLFGGAGVGFYWTEHVKTEVDIGRTGEDKVYFFGTPQVLNGRAYMRAGLHYLRTTRAQVAQVYQFGHNAWVHPFLGAGVDVERRHQRTAATLYPTAAPYDLPITVDEPASSETKVLVSVLAGLKMYVSRRAFFRTDVGVKLRSRADEMLMRVAVGVDF